MNAQDTNWDDLRVWQDANQDGISQAGELKSMSELGITSFNVENVKNSQLLNNGNQIADTGTYTRSDGTTGRAGVTSGMAGVTSGMADVNLAVDTFNRTFADTIPTTVQTEALPDMQGSGKVRDLREAASMTTAAGTTLISTLDQFATTTTRDGQCALLDGLISDWGATSGFADITTRAADNGYTLTTNLDATHQARLTALEQFNGRSFYNMPWETTGAQGGVTGMNVGVDADGQATINISMNRTQTSLLDQAYTALIESTYDALIPQTRLQPYLDSMALSFTNGSLNMDFTAMDGLFATQHASNDELILRVAA